MVGKWISYLSKQNLCATYPMDKCSETFTLWHVNWWVGFSLYLWRQADLRSIQWNNTQKEHNGITYMALSELLMGWSYFMPIMLTHDNIGHLRCIGCEGWTDVQIIQHVNSFVIRNTWPISTSVLECSLSEVDVQDVRRRVIVHFEVIYLPHISM